MGSKRDSRAVTIGIFAAAVIGLALVSSMFESESDGDALSSGTVDQDPASLRVIANTYHSPRIVPPRASIARLLDGTAELGKFDFIYAAGLLDYLDDATVCADTAWCRSSLTAGGSILLANFSECDERGFMESVMQWPLVYRSAPLLAELVGKVVGPEVTSFRDPLGIVAYSEARLQKA